MNLLGLFHSWSDPSAAVIRDNRIVAFVEEERLQRLKHAKGYFPSRAVSRVLNDSGLGIRDIDRVVQAWDCEAHESGEIEARFTELNKRYPPSEQDRAYQARRIGALTATRQRATIQRHLRQLFGDAPLPPISFVPHHLMHAVMAYAHSGMPDALVLTIDGSGEWTTTGWWRANGHGRLELLRDVSVPHSLGWLYSAFTEYLGFDAYDGEYKVMGLAAYGGEGDPLIRRKLEELVWSDDAGGFETAAHVLAIGPRRYSDYFPDALVEHMGRPPRAACEEITDWHVRCAYEVQRALEGVVSDMLEYWQKETGLRRLVIGGGVGLNVKLNGRLLGSGAVDDLFVHPLCADTGSSIGAAMTYAYLCEHLEPTPLYHVYFGPEYSDIEIERILNACKLTWTHETDIETEVARLIADGKVVGWFQGRMEAGPRALGNRSILADPRVIESRDRVNAVIKFREFWRPFCPSMTPEGADRYLERHNSGPFMIVTYDATREAKRDIPAVVHVDDTCRAQVVTQHANPRYHRLLIEFEKRTGVPVLLNTSFNIKGEPIVCTPHDAIRTFSATGLDALAIGSYLLVKPLASSCGEVNGNGS